VVILLLLHYKFISISLSGFIFSNFLHTFLNVIDTSLVFIEHSLNTKLLFFYILNHTFHTSFFESTILIRTSYCIIQFLTVWISFNFQLQSVNSHYSQKFKLKCIVGTALLVNNMYCYNNYPLNKWRCTGFLFYLKKYYYKNIHTLQSSI